MPPDATRSANRGLELNRRRHLDPDRPDRPPSLDVFRDPDHRRALLVGKLDHLEAEAAFAGARQLHRRAELGKQPRLAPFLQPLHDGLEDDEGHPRQALELLVSMDPPFEIDLAETLEAGSLGGVDEMPDLDCVPREERDRLEQRPPPGIFAGERLDHPRQLREEQVDERPRDELGDPAAATLLEDATLDDRALVVALHVLETRLVEERPERPVDHPGMPVADVRVGPDDDVPGRLEDRLPEGLALATERAIAWQDVRMLDDPCPLGLGDLAGPVG